MEYKLLTSQADEVFLEIKKIGLDHSAFEFIKIDSTRNSKNTVSKLRFKGTNYYYIFDINLEKQYSIYSPGREKMIDQNFDGSWELQKNSVIRWLSYLIREIGSPNFWENLKNSELTETEDINDNSAFNSSEQLKIGESLKELKEYITKAHTLSVNQSDNLQKKIDYLIDSSSRLGRKDWYAILFSILIQEAIHLNLNSEQVRSLFQIASQIFNWFVHKIGYIQLA